VNKYSLVSIT